MLKLRFSVLVFVLLLAGVQPVNAHPSDGFTPNDASLQYGTAKFGFTSDFNINDLTFTSPYGDPALLTNTEKYILMGCPDSARGGALKAWYVDVFQMVNAMYIAGGIVPSELRLGEMKAFIESPAEGIDDTVFDVFRSPITGEFPRLDAQEFSPGQIYMRALTEEETDFLAGRVPQLNDAWNNASFHEGMTDRALSVSVHGGVFYMRVYGERDVLIDTIMFALKVNESSSTGKLTQAVDGSPNYDTPYRYERLGEEWED